MPPIPAPVESEIESVREIARITSYAQTAILVDVLNNSQWSATLDDVDEWSGVKPKHTEIKAGLLGANVSPAMRKLVITNRVRERLGLEPVTLTGTVINTSSGGVGWYASAAIPITSDW